MNHNHIKFDILYNNTTGDLKKYKDIINDEKYKSTILERIANRYDNKRTTIDIKFLKNNWNGIEIDTFLNIIKNLKLKNYDDIDVKDVKKYIQSLSDLPEIISYMKKIKNKDLLEYRHTIRWINDWITLDYNSPRKLHDIPSYIEKYCVRRNYNELFRGLSWDLDTEYNISQLIETDYNKYSINDYIDIKSQIFTSWTKNLDMAKFFAKKRKYGIIIKLSNIRQKNVLCDILETTTPKSLFGPSEEEVILYPNRLKCQIIDIFNNGTPVNSIIEIGLDRFATIDI